MLAPLGITLSALLASTSVMKSIQNTNRIEERKKEKEEKQFKNKLKIYMDEIVFFIEVYVNFQKKLDTNPNNITEETRDEILIYIKNSLYHSKKLIINDINFLEKIEKEEFKIISDLNRIEIGLEHISKKFNLKTVYNINNRIIKLINEMKEVNKLYDLKMKLEEYENKLISEKQEEI